MIWWCEGGTPSASGGTGGEEEDDAGGSNEVLESVWVGGVSRCLLCSLEKFILCGNQILSMSSLIFV